MLYVQGLRNTTRTSIISQVERSREVHASRASSYRTQRVVLHPLVRDFSRLAPATIVVAKRRERSTNLDGNFLSRGNEAEILELFRSRAEIQFRRRQLLLVLQQIDRRRGQHLGSKQNPLLAD